MKKILLLSCCTFISILVKAQVNTLYHPEIIPIQLERISAPLRDLPQPSASELKKAGKRHEKENPSLEHEMPVTNPSPLPVGPDPALQKIYGQRSSHPKEGKMDTVSPGITLLSNWEGLSDNVDPSDNNIAVGPNHVMQMINLTYIRIWDKEGNLLVPNVTVSSITGTGNIGDPTLVYDSQADRFVFLVIKNFNGKLTVCISQTNDPTGSYYVYTFHVSGGLPDYPKIAVWGNSYLITTNSNVPSVWALNRDSLLAGASFGYVQKFALGNLPNIGFQSASPVTFTGTTLPSEGEPAIIMRVADDAWGGNVDSDHLELFKVNIDWVDSSQTSISGPFNLKTIDYNSNLCGFDGLGGCLPQPNSNIKLAPLSNIIMDKAQYRAFSDHESIVCSHVVNASGNGRAGIRWYELRKETESDWYIFQQGTYAPIDTNHRWMSSISINDKGTIALVYNITSKVTFPGIRVTGRVSCDSLNIMTEGELIVQEGSTASNIYRYGDYNSVVTDPADGSFWITAQYNPTGNWGTRVAHFTIAPCLATNSSPVASAGSDFKVSPNPATNRLDISFHVNGDENSFLQVIDLSGRRILQQTLSSRKGSNTFAIDLHGMHDGFYTLQLKTRDGTLLQKVVVQR